MKKFFLAIIIVLVGTSVIIYLKKLSKNEVAINKNITPETDITPMPTITVTPSFEPDKHLRALLSSIDSDDSNYKYDLHYMTYGSSDLFCQISREQLSSLYEIIDLSEIVPIGIFNAEDYLYFQNHGVDFFVPWNSPEFHENYILNIRNYQLDDQFFIDIYFSSNCSQIWIDFYKEKPMGFDINPRKIEQLKAQLNYLIEPISQSPTTE